MEISGEFSSKFVNLNNFWKKISEKREQISEILKIYLI